MGFRRLFGKEMVGLWTRELLITVLAVFLMRFGEGIVNGARMNFFIDTLGISGSQVLWLEGIREIPGLILIFIAALTMHLPLPWRAALSALVLGLGYMSFSLVHSYLGLLAAAVGASFGLHMYQPIGPALGLVLATEETRGRVLGVLSSVGALASIIGMGALTLLSAAFKDFSLRWYYISGGGIIAVSALAFLRLSKNLGATAQKPPRLVIKARYWRFYLLKFFEGSRKEVLGSFCTLLLVERFGWKVWQLSPLLLGASAISFVLSPYLGMAVDRFGPKRALVVSYSFLALACVAYATINNALILAVLYVTIRLAEDAVRQRADPERKHPTGQSTEHPYLRSAGRSPP